MLHRDTEALNRKSEPFFFGDPYYSKFFQLMPYQIRQVLIVASPYDFFVLEEDGRLADLLSAVYKRKDLGYIPTISRVTSCAEGLDLLKRNSFDLVVVVYRSLDTDVFAFTHQAKSIRPDLPIVCLTFNIPELYSLFRSRGKAPFDDVFLWQGDGRVLVGIVELVEDKLNAEYDVGLIGVPNVLIVEDSMDFYSTYLNVIYDLLWELTSRLLEDKLPYEERIIRQRGRPKIHLATTFEEALEVFNKFQSHFLGIITDVSFPRDGKERPSAGIDFASYVKSRDPNLPIVIQSSDNSVKNWTKPLETELILKSSPSLIVDFRSVLLQKFGFGDLILSTNGGNEIARIPTLESLIYVIESLPAESLYDCYKKGCLRRWLLARTEFQLADAIERPEFSETANALAFRAKLSELLHSDRVNRQLGKVVPYSRRFSAGQWHFCRMGGGSMGGKARGLAFFDKVLSLNLDPRRFSGIKIEIPRTLVLGTDIFDEFLEANRLIPMAYEESSNIRLANAFINSSLPPTVLGDLRHFIREVQSPLAIRSSSLLEDALYHPFAGIYMTKMIPNNLVDLDARFLSLVNAIKLVYASTFFKNAKAYLEATNHKVQEEKMAVIIQEVVGQKRDKKFYPDFSGVAKSYNYYPFGGARPEDGVANIALGLGKTVVEGEASLVFIPANPKIPASFSSIEEQISQSQREFYCINMQPIVSKAYTEEEQYLLKLGLEEAEKDGALKFLASTYSREDDRIYAGLMKNGARVLTFAQILQSGIFPLADILIFLLKLAEEAMGTAVEIEFACSLNPERIFPAYFGFLQVRPMLSKGELVDVKLEEISREALILYSEKVLGNGVFEGIRDIILVKMDNFDPAKSRTVAWEVGILNSRLKSEGRPYILIGPGRWGSADPWLGIPVNWEQISGVKMIVEIPFKGKGVDPSQGSHFFHNLTALRVGYFTISQRNTESFMDQNFLEKCTVFAETEHLKWLRFSDPLIVQVDGRTGKGVILKPKGKK